MPTPRVLTAPCQAALALASAGHGSVEIPTRSDAISPWLDRVGPAVRHFSVSLLAGLLDAEANPAQARAIAEDLGTLAHELLEARDYNACAVAVELLAQLRTAKPAIADSCRGALDRLATSAAFHHAADQSTRFDDQDDADWRRICKAVGIRVVNALCDVPDHAASPLAHGETAQPGTPSDDTTTDVIVLRKERDHARAAARRATAELEILKGRIEHLVRVDPLTETLTPRGLEAILETEFKRTRRTGTHPVALLLDCDNFKATNRERGRAVGDRVLVAIAHRIQSMLRPTDHVARVGTDAFLIILPETGYWEALRVAERLMTSITRPVDLGCTDPATVSARIGICAIPSVVLSFDQIMELALDALRKSTTPGDNITERLTRDTSYRAIREPIVRLDDNRVSAYELLARSTIEGYEAPSDFLQIAFRHKIMSVVDRLCLKACLTTAAAVRDEGMLHHVNLFPSTILNTAANELLDALGSVPLTTLCVEVTEQQFAGDSQDLKQRLDILRRAGVRIALDDVGFGRTSLELLILLEPDIVKIDRRFVKGVSRDPLQAAAFHRLSKVIDALGAPIIAEGIETERERQALREFGVEYGQGYLWPALQH